MWSSRNNLSPLQRVDEEGWAISVIAERGRQTGWSQAGSLWLTPVTKGGTMTAHQSFVFENEMFNDRFLAMVEILVIMVRMTQRASTPVTLSRLATSTNRPPRMLIALCGELQSAGLLQQDAFCPNKWSLNCDPTRVSLEDVFRCAHPLVEGIFCKPRKMSSSVELMVTHALVAIHQSFFKHLRDCSLHRVVISDAGMFPDRKPLPHGFARDEAKRVSSFSLAADCPSPFPVTA